MAMGMIDDLIEQKLIKNQEGYDIVDEFIIEQALNLDNRHISVFGLLYQCHSVQEVRERLISKGQKPKQITSLEGYRRNSFTDLIKIVTESESKIKSLKKKVRHAYDEDTN